MPRHAARGAAHKRARQGHTIISGPHCSPTRPAAPDLKPGWDDSCALSATSEDSKGAKPHIRLFARMLLYEHAQSVACMRPACAPGRAAHHMRKWITTHGVSHVCGAQARLQTQPQCRCRFQSDTDLQTAQPIHIAMAKERGRKLCVLWLCKSTPHRPA